MSANPETVRALILLGTAWLVGALWMCHRARTEALIRRCGGRR